MYYIVIWLFVLLAIVLTVATAVFVSFAIAEIRDTWRR